MSMHILPDSRLKEAKGTVIVNWELTDGSTVRIEVEPIYCANCGKLYGYVPKENTTFAFWLCRKCFEAHGEIAGTYAVPEDEFNQKVQTEMQERFGRDLTDLEIFKLLEQGELGRPLELLIRESPYKVPNDQSL